MELFGIKFAPIDVPLERRMQIVAVAAVIMFLLGGFVGVLSSIYLVLFTSWRWLTILYLIWMYVIDRKTPERGGRRSQWLRNCAWWKYLIDYFPFKMELMPSVQLDPKKNYVICGVPHGVFGVSLCCAIASNTNGFPDLFPLHTSYAVTMNYFFKLPFFREMFLATGFCNSSANSINYLLEKPDGGNIVFIAIGGVAEALNSRLGQYRLVLRNRKGFVKLALKNGSPLVPVISFGEADLYDQLANANGSFLRNLQEVVKKWTRITPIIPIGRGFFQYSFGLLPRRTPLTMLVGRPIEVEKIVVPTQGQIDDLHSKFVDELTKLFEGQKHRYIQNAESVRLQIE